MRGNFVQVRTGDTHASLASKTAPVLPTVNGEDCGQLRVGRRIRVTSTQIAGISDSSPSFCRNTRRNSTSIAPTATHPPQAQRNTDNNRRCRRAFPTPRCRPAASGSQAINHRHQHACALHHRRIDYLAAPEVRISNNADTIPARAAGRRHRNHRRDSAVEQVRTPGFRRQIRRPIVLCN